MNNHSTPWQQQIPENWQLQPNRVIFQEVIQRNSKHSKMLSVTITKGIITQKKLLSNSSKKDTSNTDKSNYKEVLKGDFAYNKMRMWQGAVGLSSHNGIVSPAYTVLRTKLESCNKYYHYLLRTQIYSQICYRHSYGICDDQLTLRFKDFKTIYTPTPPLQTQRQIATFLDRKTEAIDTLIEKKKQLIERLEEKRSALINHVVTKGLDPDAPMKDSGIEWIGEVPREWEHWNVRNLIRAGHLDIQDGNHGELHPTVEDYVPNGIPFILANNIKKNQINITKCKQLTFHRAEKLRIGFARKGDVLLTHKGTIGAVAIVTSTQPHPYFVLTPQVTYYRIRTKISSPEYIALWFMSRAFQTEMNFQASMGSTRAFLGIVAQRNLPIVLPPPQIQAAILNSCQDILLKLTKLTTLLTSQIEKLQEYRQALITAAVTGQIDVSGEVVDEDVEGVDGEVVQEDQMSLL